VKAVAERAAATESALTAIETRLKGGAAPAPAAGGVKLD